MSTRRAKKRKEHPLSMRLPDADIAIIDRAAGIKGRSRTDFVREAAVRAAEDVLIDSTPFRMSSSGFGSFMKALALALSTPDPLTATHDVSQFSSGKPTLGHWLKTRALSNQEKGLTAVIVVHENNRVVGYYGLAPTALVPAVMPRSIRTGQPPDPVPCLLLGQLATDAAWAGNGIGTGLLKHAPQRCIAASHLIGGRALVVNAVDSEAADFWRRRGFLPSKDDPLVLFRSMADIAASIKQTAAQRQ